MCVVIVVLVLVVAIVVAAACHTIRGYKSTVTDESETLRNTFIIRLDGHPLPFFCACISSYFLSSFTGFISVKSQTKTPCTFGM